ncbi:dehydrogenase E1 component [Stagonosporopsis vannaccii]|nr:dehydrogenase E1 component [Stagonosporopsis vannaccii]
MNAVENSYEDLAVAVSYFGEGAASEGDFYRALDVAATQQCAVIFICWNNGLAYRNAQEVKEWNSRFNSLGRLRKWLEHKRLWDKVMEEETRKTIRRDVLQELMATEKEKKPALAGTLTHIYAELTEEAEAQR